MKGLRRFPTLFLLLLSLAATPRTVGHEVAASEPSPPRTATGAPFFENLGQLDGPALYYARTATGAVYFEPTAMLLDRAPDESGEGVVLRIDFPQRGKDFALEARQPLEVRSHFFAGPNPGNWRSDLPGFGEIFYHGIAPGADLSYRVSDGRLKYDVLLAPGAELAPVAIRYQGVESLRIGPQGELLLATIAGDLVEEPPLLYQERDHERLPVPGGYRIVSEREVGFWAGPYDRTLPLVIDPGILWSTFLGGSGTDILYQVATDPAGDVYTVGISASSGYPTTSGAYQRTPGGGTDIVVSKLRGDGTAILWSTFLGGGGADEARSLTLDGAGNIYLCGRTSSADFPTTPNAPFRSFAGGLHDAFIAKLSPGGGTLVFSTYLGGNGDDLARAVCLDRSGRAVFAGVTGSTNLPTTAGIVRAYRSPGFSDGADGFLGRLNAAGSSLELCTYLGTDTQTEGVTGMVLDPNDHPIVVGSTKSSNFPVTAGAYQTALRGAEDAFVTRLNSDCTAYELSTFLGGNGVDGALSVVLDDQGALCVAGRTNSPDFPATAGGYQRTFGGGINYDGFLVRLSANGTSLLAGTFLGGSGTDLPIWLTSTSNGYVCAAGYTDSGDFPTSPGAFDRSANGGYDAFVTALPLSLGSLQYSTLLGGSSADEAFGLAWKPTGELVVCGFAFDGGFPTTPQALDPTHNGPGVQDGFVTVVDAGLQGDPVAAEVGFPRGVHLVPPRPNPFTADTWIGLDLDREAEVQVRVLDAHGRVLRNVANGLFGPGRHGWTWDGRSNAGARLASGVYFFEVVADGRRETRRVVRLH